MTEAQWITVTRHFNALCAIPLEQREAALAAISDESIRGEVASLLEHSEGGTVAGALDAIELQASLLDSSGAASLHDTLGPYQLSRRIGRGAQGTVFEGVRNDGAFQKHVAIKILQTGADYPEARIRFAQERQILAALEHPHIARLLDGGETETGLNYVVLEFVDGANILEYAAATSLPTEDRLRLFLKVCDAVQYAHQNLVVHRDLKPGNILVTGDGTPKLVDFGIAKMLQSDATRTMTGFQSFTPRYASPEQVRGGPITTATDIYSLGVVLYELLTGRHPYTVPSGSRMEIEQAVCSNAPDAPGVSSDIDNILLMALRKEPHRRYSSVEQFSADIRRYLTGMPVAAHGESWTYAAGKFLRRNRLGVLAAALVLISATTVFISTYREKQRVQRDFADVRQLAGSFLFDIEGQLHDLPGATKARETVVSSALTYLNRLSQDARGDPALLQEIALAYEKTATVEGWPAGPNLGHFREALTTFNQAVAIWEELLKRNPSDAGAATHLSVCLSETADVQRQLRQYKEAETLSQRAREFALRAVQGRPGDFTAQRAAVQAYRGLGMAAMGQGKTAEAIPLFRQAVDILEKLPVPRAQTVSYEYATLLGGGYAMSLVRQGQLEEALRAVNRALAIYETDLAGWAGRSGLERNRINTYQTKGNLLGARDRPNLGRPAEALAAYERARDLAEISFRADPNNVLAREDYALGFGKIADLVAVSNPQLSLQLSDRALAILRQKPSDDPAREAEYSMSVSEPLRVLGRTREARERLGESMTIYRRMLAESPADVSLRSLVSSAYEGIADIDHAEKQWRNASENYQHALELLEPITQPHPEDLRMQWQLGELYDSLAANAEEAKKAQADGLAWTAESGRWRQKARELWQNWMLRSPDSDYGRERLRRLADAPGH